ncbi:MAG TPA: hypothetical protein VIR03_00830 [Candidatus Saccharimonadales bacterium]
MKQLSKRLGLVALAVSSLLTMALSAFPVKVAAAGETYTWKDYNTITIAGGDFTGAVDYKLSQGTNGVFIAAPSYPNYQNKCQLSLTVTLINDNSAKLTVPLPAPNANVGYRPPNRVYCDDGKYAQVCSGVWPFQSCHVEYQGPLFPGVSEGYNGQTVTIQGTRGSSNNQSEADMQREVVVVINSPNPGENSPTTIAITVKDANGNVVSTVNPAQEAAQIGFDPGKAPVYYLGDFHLDPGKYTVCADIVIPDCRSFEKVKFKSLHLEYGDTSVQRTLTVNIITTYVGAIRDLTVGPYTVSVRKPGGVTLTQKTGTNTHTMTNAESQAQGMAQATYTLPIYETFNGLDPVTYEVCIEGVPDCKNVTKTAGQPAEVTFNIDYNQFNADNNTEQDCKAKYSVMNVKGITYLVCSVIDTATYAVGALDGTIGNMLTINTNDIFTDSGAGVAYHAAWNSFRIFALGLLVIAALIMVVSQALDLDIVNAYTIRKTLPRLLFAVVFITFSWSLLQFAAELSNTAGQGMRTLIYAPFRDLPQGGSIGGGTLAAMTLIGTGGALALGWVGLLSFVLTGLIASLAAVAVLIIRKMILLLLFMLAPFAIAAAVLPGTRKAYDFWRDTLIGMLVVFPIITTFIAIGRVFSAMAFNAPGSQTVNQLIAVIAYFVPYFLITKAFTMAGGLMAKVSGMVNSRSGGLQGRVKKYRGNKINQNVSKMAHGQRFQNSNPLARAFNTATFNVGATVTAKSQGAQTGNLFTRQGRAVRAAMLAQQRMINADAYRNSDRFKAAMNNDPLLRAQTYRSEAEARARMIRDFDMYEKNADGTYKTDEDGERIAKIADVESAISAARANGGFGRDQQLAAVNQLFATGTGFDDARQAVEAIARVSGDNSEMAMGIIGEGNFVAGEVGRTDLRLTFGKYAELYSKIAAGGTLTDDDISGAYLTAALESDSYTALHGKPKAAENIVPALRRELEKARMVAGSTSHSNDERAAARELSGRIAGLIEQYEFNAGMYSSPVIREHVQTKGVAPTVETREDIQHEASDVALVRDPASGQLVPQVVPAPTAANPRAVQTLPNTRRNADTQRGYNQTSPRRPR